MSIEASTRLLPVLAPAPPATARIDVVVPVHNERHVLARSVRRLHAFLSDGFPFAWRIVIAGNASTDGTSTLGCSRRLDRDHRLRPHDTSAR